MNVRVSGAWDRREQEAHDGYPRLTAHCIGRIVLGLSHIGANDTEQFEAGKAQLASHVGARGRQRE
jgi:hypothetical protein